MHFIIILFWYINHISHLCFWKILYLDLFCCIYTCECRCKINLSFIFYLQIWLCAYTNKCHFRISSRHVVQMNVYCWRIGFVLCWSKLYWNNCKTFWLNESYLRIESKSFSDIASHFKINWCVRLVDQLETVIHWSVQKCWFHNNIIGWENFHHRQKWKRIKCKWMSNTFYHTWNWWKYLSTLDIFFYFGLNSLIKLDIS